jgi:hypothetical protein
MILKAKYFFFLVLPFFFSSCFLKKKKENGYQQNNFYNNDINDHRTPTQIAKEYSELGKKQKRAYRKQQRAAARAIKKRNKQALKNIVIKTKTKKVRGKSKTEDKGSTKTIEVK